MYPEGRCCRAEEMELWVGWGEEREKLKNGCLILLNRNIHLFSLFFFFSLHSHASACLNVCALFAFSFF